MSQSGCSGLDGERATGSKIVGAAPAFPHDGTWVGATGKPEGCLDAEGTPVV